MGKFVVLPVLAVMLITASSANAAIYEGFDYNPNNVDIHNLASKFGTNYTSTTGAGEVKVIGSGLNYGNLNTGLSGRETGRAIERIANSNTTTGVRNALNSAHQVDLSTGTDVFVSVLVRAAAGPRNIDLLRLGLNSGNQIQIGDRERPNNNTNDRRFRIFTTEGGNSNFFNYVNNRTYLFVGRIRNSAANNGDSVIFDVYDTTTTATVASTFPGAQPAGAVARLSDSGFNFVNPAGGLKINNLGANLQDNNNFVDEIRIGGTYADVTTPEPSTYVVFGGLMACFGLAGWWRKRRHRAA